LWCLYFVLFVAHCVLWCQTLTSASSAITCRECIIPKYFPGYPRFSAKTGGFWVAFFCKWLIARCFRRTIKEKAGKMAGEPRRHSGGE
jgi:hypothetical protein